MVAGVPVAPVYVAAFVLSLLLFGAFTFFFKYSRYGIAMRATAFDQQAAQSMGIGIKNIFALSWCIAAVVSSIGGIILGNINGINIQLGQLGLKVRITSYNVCYTKLLRPTSLLSIQYSMFIISFPSPLFAQTSPWRA